MSHLRSAITIITRQPCGGNNSLDCGVGVVDARSLREVAFSQADAPNDATAVDERAGRLITLGSYEGVGAAMATVIDLATGSQRYVTLSQGPRGIVVPDEQGGRAMAIAVTTYGDFHTPGLEGATVADFIDERGGKIARSTPLGMSAGAVAAVIDRRRRAYIALTRYDPATTDGTKAPGVVEVLDARTGRPLRAVGIGVGAVAMAGDDRRGRVFVANHDDDTVTVIDTSRP